MVRKTQLKYLYILSMTVAMFNKISGISLPWYFSYFHCVLWITLGILYERSLSQTENYYRLNRSITTVKKVFLIPYVLFWVCSIIGWTIHMKDTQINMVTRAFSNTIQFTLILASVVYTCKMFKEKLLSYTFTAMIINYLIVIATTIGRYGVSDFVRTGLLPFGKAASAWSINGNASTSLEVHDLTFAAGFFLLYFLVVDQTDKKKNLKNIMWCCVLIYLGYKRIELGALFLVYFVAIFLKNKSKKGVRFWSLIFSLIGLFLSLVFIWGIKTNYLEVLAELYNINFMGRLKSYRYMREYFDMTPLYLGRGIGAAARINQSIRASVNIVQGHSEILYTYIDVGFSGFILWILYCGYGATRRITRTFGSETGMLWLVFTAYAYITYFTDNTTIYFAFQSSYMIIIFHMMYTKSSIKSISKNRKSGG